jgi:2-isopropylmalate synthase
MAVLNGARQVECTVNGLGERAGNASLEEIVMILRTRKDIFNVETNINTKEISNTSRLVSHICGVPIQPNKAIVGANAFSHSSGIHQDGMLKNQSTYEIMTPESVGLDKNTLNLTSRSGRAVIQHRLANLGYEKDTYDMGKFYANFLALADKKGSVYDDDLEALMEIGSDVDESKYSLEYLNVSSGRGIIATSTVRVSDGDIILQEAATGDGPVDATYEAISRATGMVLEVVDYSLSGVTGGRDALGEVKRFHGHGSSTDIIEASAQAYINATNKVERNIKVEEVRKSKNK